MDINNYLDLILDGKILNERQCKILCEKLLTIKLKS